MNATQRDWDIIDIQSANRVRGYHFFDASAKRFFNSRILADVYQGLGGIFFVTSERFDDQSPRLFTVRRFNPDKGTIDTIGDFNVLSRYRAIKAARKAAQGAS